MKGVKFYVLAGLPNKNYHRNIAILWEPQNQKSSHQVKSRRFPGFLSRHQVLTSYVIQQPINHQPINLAHPFEISAKFLSPKGAKQFR